MSAKHVAAAALLLTAHLVQAGQVSIVNNCEFDIFVTPSQLGKDSPIETYQPGQTFTAPISGEAQDLKIMTHRGFCFANECVQLEYTVAGKDLFYDLSNINAKGMEKFIEFGMSVENDDPNAPQVHCPPGKGQCEKGVYNQWFENESTFCSKADANIKMNLCLHRVSDYKTPENAQGGSLDGSPAVDVPAAEEPAAEEPDEPVPAPAPTTMAIVPSYSAPAPLETRVRAVHQLGQNEDGSLGFNVADDVVYVTDIVTVATTVWVKRSVPTEAPEVERRHVHRHAHAHQQYSP